MSHQHSHHPHHAHSHSHGHGHRRPSQELSAGGMDGKKVPEPRPPAEKLNLDLATLNKELTVDEIRARRKEFESRAESVLTKTVLGPNDNEFDLVGWERSKDGGLKCVNMAELERQKGVVSHLIKSFGANLVSGRSVVNVSLPVRVFEPRSFLERIPDAWGYPIYLVKAAFAATPVERLQWVVTFMVAGLHRAVTNLKPFNPILGETFEAAFKDGTQMWLEQISHHPPMSAFQMVGPHRLFHMHGHHEFAASMSPNSVLGQQLGDNVVDFFDGGRIVYTNPYALVKGIVWGERNYTWVGTAHFRDEQNHLSCNVVFNPDEKNGLVRMFSAQKTPDDHFRGDIMYSPPEKEPKHVPTGDPKAQEKRKRAKPQQVGVVSGSWMDGVNCGPDAEHLKPFWVKSTIKPLKCVPVENPLPSDSRYREDLIFLLAGDEDESQKWKGVLEERQRYDEKVLRKSWEKNRKKTIVTSPLPVSQSHPRLRQSMSDLSVSEKDK